MVSERKRRNSRSGGRKKKKLAKLEARVISYNVLAPNLCTSKRFSLCSETDCDPETRYKRVEDVLQGMIDEDSDAIIALQEVSRDWAGRLYVFFRQQGYDFLVNSYSSRFTDYMGVALAIPPAYTVERYKNARISDVKDWKKKPRGRFDKCKYKLKDFWRGFLALLWLLLCPIILLGRTVYDACRSSKYQAFPNAKKKWDAKACYFNARDRYNSALFVELSHPHFEQPFVVANYHMPCAFFAPLVMLLHTSMLTKAVHKYADGKPIILCGDFNFKPGSPSYELITTGRISSKGPNSDSIKPLPFGDRYRIDTNQPLFSVYALNQEQSILNSPVKRSTRRSRRNSSAGISSSSDSGDSSDSSSSSDDSSDDGSESKHVSVTGEPEFTNMAWLEGNKERFVGTLDYIFVSPGSVSVLETDDLPTLQDILDTGTQSFPSSEHPSDHLPVGAVVEISQL